MIKRSIFTIVLATAAMVVQAQEWFKTDSVTIQGRIEGYDAEQFGFTSMSDTFDDVFEKEGTVLVLDINDDGTFCKKFKVSYPVRLSFSADESKVGFKGMRIFARPGETIDVTVAKDANGKYQCRYNGGSSSEVQRWLRSGWKFSELSRAMWRFKGKLDEANLAAEMLWQIVNDSLQQVAKREGYTPLEMQLAQADIQARFGEGYLTYVANHESDLIKWEQRDGKYHMVITDSAEWQKKRDYDTYKPLKHVDFTNPLLFASDDISSLLNRVQYAEVVWEDKNKGVTNEMGNIEINYDIYVKELSNYRTALNKLTGGKDNLMTQLCVYKTFAIGFDHWRSYDDDIPKIKVDTRLTKAEREKVLKTWPTLDMMTKLYISALPHSYLRQKAEQFMAIKLAQKDLAAPLPDKPMADLIHKLSAKYPGRILVIDFWGMTCGPCRLAIQTNKDLRAEIAKRNDVKLIFIAGERTTEGSDAYKKYVAEWLADEETVCVTNQDFAKLRELFQFNGIPHFETFTPDCRRVRDDLQIHGYNAFDYELQMLIDKLK